MTFSYTDNLLLALAALLLGLLLATRSRAEVDRRQRHTPLSPDELGRYVYQAAQSRDADAFRDLFLRGAEARRVLGPQAMAYLDHLTPDRRLRALADIVASLPSHAAYQSTLIDPEGHMRLRVRAESGVVADIDVGRAVKVGAAWRIQDPVSRSATA